MNLLTEIREIGIIIAMKHFHFILAVFFVTGCPSLALAAPDCPKSKVEFLVNSALIPPTVNADHVKNLQATGVSVNFVEQLPHKTGANICKYFTTLGWKKVNPALPCPPAVYLKANNSVFDGSTTGYPTAESKVSNATHCMLQGHQTAKNPISIYTVIK